VQILAYAPKLIEEARVLAPEQANIRNVEQDHGEALEAEAASGKLGKRYRDVQLKQRSGKKAFYRNLKARRHRNK